MNQTIKPQILAINSKFSNYNNRLNPRNLAQNSNTIDFQHKLICFDQSLLKKKGR